MKQMVQDIFKAFISCFTAFQIINRFRLWKYYFWVVLLSIVIFIFSIYLFFNFTDYLGSLISEKIDTFRAAQGQSEKFSNFISRVSTFILRVLFKGFGLYLFFKFSKYLYLILFSPLFAYISELIEEKLFDIYTPFSVVKIIKDAIRGVIVSVRNLIIELVFSGFVIVSAFFFPILALPLGVLSLVLGFYYFGYAVMDYNHERWSMSISRSSARVRLYKGHAIGLGLFYYLANMIPIIGWVFSGINTTIAAVLLEQKKHPLLKIRAVENSYK